MTAVPALAAQQKAIPVVGFLSSTAPEPYASRLAAFQSGLEQAGFVEGRDVAQRATMLDYQRWRPSLSGTGQT
jgi:putative ABC transport system substrate-binding protein